MSFSGDVKREISSISAGDRHCRISTLSAMINTCGKLPSDSAYSLIIKSENRRIIEICSLYFIRDFKISGDEWSESERRLNKNSVYYLGIKKENTEVFNKLLLATGLMDRQTGEVKKHISPLVTKSTCCKKAYLRSAFVCAGSISDPQKTYHLEFITELSSPEYSDSLVELLEFFGLSPKKLTRKGHIVVYFKESEQIADILNIMGAHVSLMEFENCRVGKEVSNSINRTSNCSTANADKSIKASVLHIKDVEFISRHAGLESLPPALLELAQIRLDNPLLSMQEIGTMFNPPVSKSGVNHRLRKISKIADELRESN